MNLVMILMTYKWQQWEWVIFVQVPEHSSLKAPPAYQGLPHWKICHLSPKILHISGLKDDYHVMITMSFVFLCTKLAQVNLQMWCFQTQIFLEHLQPQKIPDLMWPDFVRAQKDAKPMRADFRFKGVAQDPIPEISPKSCHKAGNLRSKANILEKM